MMLVLSRKVSERIHIDPDIEILVVAIYGPDPSNAFRVRIGIEAPGRAIMRTELIPQPTTIPQGTE